MGWQSEIDPQPAENAAVILKHLAREFELGVQYPEAKVNQILGRYHEDYAALRRYMVDNGFLQREKGLYWKAEVQG